MTRHVGYIHDFKLEPFSPPCFCQSGFHYRLADAYLNKEGR